MLIWLLAGLVVLTFWVALVGAPYVPTRRQDVGRLFDIVDLPAEGRLVDLGSGDGRLLIEAARRQRKSTGYELSLPVWLVSWFRLRPYAKAEVRWANFWRQHLPDDTAVVFTFLAGRYMARLDGFIQAEADRLGRPLQLVSYGFELPGRQPSRQTGALLVYRYQPRSKA